MTITAERPTSGPNADLTNDQLRAEIDRSLKRLLNVGAAWTCGERNDFELYLVELVEEALRRMP